MKPVITLVLIVLSGCAGTWANSPYAKGCADELGVSLNPWYHVGTVQAELVNMCIKRKEKAG